jgi:hypothetical protein
MKFLIRTNILLRLSAMLENVLNSVTRICMQRSERRKNSSVTTTSALELSALLGKNSTGTIYEISIAKMSDALDRNGCLSAK